MKFFINKLINNKFFLIITVTSIAVIFSELLVYAQVKLFWKEFNTTRPYWLGFWTPLIDALIVCLILLYFRKKYEDRLEKQTKLLKESERIAHIGFWQLEIEKNSLQWSEETYNIFELEKSQFEPKYEYFLEIIHPEDKDFVNKAYTNSLKNKLPYQIKHRLLMKDGRIKWVIERCHTEFDNKGKPKVSLGTIQDVTKEHYQEEELRRKDIQLYEQSKLAEMGEMLANISHQWRQPLNTISTATSGLKLQNEIGTLSDKNAEEFFKAIMNNTDYLSKTIETFTNFIKLKKEKKEVSIKNEIETSINIVEASLKAHFIKLVNQTKDKEDILIKLPVHEISQVIINIINNAKDVIIEREIKDKWIKVALTNNDKELEITIEDSAGGIDKDILPRIFEPYFTTKHQSIGTGLGLHMSYKIVTESLKGKLFVENTNNGAKFHIKIPII